MPRSRYSPWTRRLHWLIFLLVAGALLLIYLHHWSARGTALHADAKWAHMQFGMAVLLVMLPRLIARRRNGKPPPIVPSAPRWQMAAATCMHLALYVLLIGTPLLGIASRLWNPGGWNFLGIPLPLVASPNLQFAHMLEGIHETFGHILMYLAGAHAAIALFHHFAQRDNTLRRMLPPRRAQN